MRRLGLLLCLLTAFLTVGCTSPYVAEQFDLTVGGAVEIDVDCFRGDVIVKADPRLNEAFVRIVRTGAHGYDRHKEARASLDDITTSVELVPGTYGQRLQVRTATMHAEPAFQRTDVYITLPLIEGMRIRTEDGNIGVVRGAGAMDLETSNGDVAVKTSVPVREPVTIISNHGGIEYITRAESTAKFDAKVVNGTIMHHVVRGDLRVLAGTDETSFQATLNDGENPVILRSVDGDIRIKVVAEPETVYNSLLY
jgi:hypothetical protein